MVLRVLATVCGMCAQAFYFVVFYTLFIPTIVFASIWKLVARGLLYIQYGPSVEIMGPCDALSAHKPAPSKEGLIHAVFHVKGPLSLKEIRRRVWENLVDAKTEDGKRKYPRLQRWVQSQWGLYCWSDVENFDFHWHVDHYRDESGNKVSYRTRDDQCDVVQKIINAPMFDDGYAPWRIHLLSREDGSESLVVLRSHHCMFDGGAAFMCILPAVADRVKEGDVFGNVKNGNFSGFRNKLLGMLCIPYLLSRQLRSFDDNPLRVHSMSKDAPDGKWTVWSDPIPLTTITCIRKKTGVRFSAVLVTAISRAVTRYVELAKVAKDWKGTPSVSAYQAVSMWTPSDPPTLENRITGVSTPMIVNLKKPLLEQLKEANASQEFWLRQEFLWGAYTFSNLTSNTVPHVLAEKFAIPWLLGGITMFVSSAMGPSNVFTVDGNEVHGLTGIMPLPPTTSLGFVLLSYGDKLGIALAGRKYAFPELEDLKKLDSLLHEEFDALLKAASPEVKSAEPELTSVEE